MKNIAFDLGASSGKVMLGDFDGEKLSTRVVYRFPNRQLTAQNGLYWNFLGIYQELLTGIGKAQTIADNPIQSVGMDSFCNDFGLLGQKGDLLTQMRCYRDLRTAECADAIYSIISKRELYEMTGCQNALFNTVIQMAAMVLQHEKFLLDGCDTMLHLPDMLTYFLCGAKKSEYTISSVTQMFDFRTDQWHQCILDRFQINQKMLAPIIYPGTVAGRFTAQVQEDNGLECMDVVAVAEHDTASAVAALPTTKEHVAYLSSGTWSLLGTEVPKPIITEESFRYNFAYEGGVDHRFRMLKNVMGLWLVQECRLEYQKLGHEYSFADLGGFAKQTRPFLAVIDPDDEVFYMPGNMLEKIQKFCRNTNQYVPDAPGEFIRIILESLAMKYRWVMDKMEHILGYQMQEIYVLGGGGQDELLDQFTANACNKRVLAGPTEAALMGNLIMQLAAYREISNLCQGREVIQRSATIKEFLPQDVQVWQQQYEYFQELLQLNRDEQKEDEG